MDASKTWCVLKNTIPIKRMVIYIPMAKKYPVVRIVGEKCMSMEPVVEKSEPLKILTELH